MIIACIVSMFHVSVHTIHRADIKESLNADRHDSVCRIPARNSWGFDRVALSTKKDFIFPGVEGDWRTWTSNALAALLQ